MSRRVIDMNDRHDDELDPVERLRAADPAASLEPSAGFADEVVARAAADAAGEGARAGDSTSSETPPVADLAAERVRRRNRWLTAAAVAASVLIVGGAGYAVGATTTGTSTVAGGAAPPISLQSGVGAATEQAVPQTDASAGGPESSKMSAGPGATDRLLPYSPGRNHFSASGLSTDEGTATAYAYDARSASNAETVGALAAGLGLSGTPELKDGGWVVGPQDGTAASLWVGLDGTLSFSYWDPQLNPWQCAPDATVCEPTGTPPGEAAAIDTLRSLISSTGRDPGAFEYASQVYEGSPTRSAQAWPLVDGQRADQAWYLELAEGGIVNASGSLAETVQLGDYPVVSEQEAFERLSDPRFGAQVTAMPFAAQDAKSAEATAPTEYLPPTEPPAIPGDGTAISWPVDDVEIVDARLGLATQWQPDGSVLLVPAYEFTDAAGGTWSVIAVADSKLDFATE
jgi:hypothetical protein